MKTSASLLLSSILAVVLLAPPAFPQNKTQEQLNSLLIDSLNLKNSVKQLQDSFDRRNTETTKLLQDVLSRFSTIDGTVQKLNETLNTLSGSIKASDEKTARDLQETRTALDAFKRTMEEGVLGLQNQVRGLSTQMNNASSAEQQLPSSADGFSQAFGDLNAGLYDLAVGEFRDFVRSYPTDPRAGAAQFYIGEGLLAQRKFDQAVVEFDLGLAKYPESVKKCSALYRKGQAHAELKETSKATLAFQTVGKECPGTQEAVNAAAALKNPPRTTRGQ
jgi:tol-pal system protein YbgF